MSQSLRNGPWHFWNEGEDKDSTEALDLQNLAGGREIGVSSPEGEADWRNPRDYETPTWLRSGWTVIYSAEKFEF